MITEKKKTRESIAEEIGDGFVVGVIEEYYFVSGPFYPLTFYDLPYTNEDRFSI